MTALHKTNVTGVLQNKKTTSEIGRERFYGEGADDILAEAEAALLDEALA